MIQDCFRDFISINRPSCRADEAFLARHSPQGYDWPAAGEGVDFLLSRSCRAMMGPMWMSQN